jgi:hypothetical protein
MLIYGYPQPKRIEDFSVFIPPAGKVEITYSYDLDSPGFSRGLIGGTLHSRAGPLFVIVIFTVTFV